MMPCPLCVADPAASALLAVVLTAGRTQQDTNYVNALNVNQIDPNKLRRSVLGSIRYGKPCVIDVMVQRSQTLLAPCLVSLSGMTSHGCQAR